MINLNIQCMQQSIELANTSKSNGLRVGIVIHVNKNHFITAVSLSNKSDWVRSVMATLQECGIKRVSGVYLSIHTLSLTGEFDLNELLKNISAKRIFIGLPDPSLSSYKNNDPIITRNNIERYPDSLQKLILNQNTNFYSQSKQNIKLIRYYSDVRISNIVQAKLKQQGITISKEVINNNKNVKKLVQYLSLNYPFQFNQANQVVNMALSEAFNEKYSIYDYRQDVRSLVADWKQNFKTITDNYLTTYYSEKNIINVGVGSGEEAMDIFSEFKNISFVDIAPGGLEKISKSMPYAQTFLLRAEDLSSISSDTYDAYISLRTYNSSFFDTSLALKEAVRILKNGAIIIISVANGFLCVDNHIIPGLLIPGSEFVDIYRGLNIAKSILANCKKLGFTCLKIIPTDTEIYIMGKLNKKLKKENHQYE
mgnify:CR=1 FL=1